MQGGTSITILFDPDEAGQKAAGMIQTMGEKLELLTKIQEFGSIKASDPGTMTEEHIRKLENKLYA